MVSEVSTGSFRNKSFKYFYVDYKGFCLKYYNMNQCNRKWGLAVLVQEPSFLTNLDIFNAILSFREKFASSLTSPTSERQKAYFTQKSCHSHENRLYRQKFAFTCIKIRYIFLQEACQFSLRFLAIWKIRL